MCVAYVAMFGLFAMFRLLDACLVCWHGVCRVCYVLLCYVLVDVIDCYMCVYVLGVVLLFCDGCCCAECGVCVMLVVDVCCCVCADLSCVYMRRLVA